jgi:hypothetical protein
VNHDNDSLGSTLQGTLGVVTVHEVTPRPNSGIRRQVVIWLNCSRIFYHNLRLGRLVDSPSPRSLYFSQGLARSFVKAFGTPREVE